MKGSQEAFIKQQRQRQAATDEKILKKLKENDIHPKPGVGDKYICHLCNYICDTRGRAQEHIQHDRHVCKVKKRKETEMLYYMPPITDIHMEALDKFLHSVVKEKSLAETECLRRKSVAKTIMEMIHSSCPDLEVSLHGSLLTGLSIEECNVNLFFCLKNKDRPAPPLTISLTQVLNALKPLKRKKDAHDSQIAELFQLHKGVPCVVALDVRGVQYQITALNPCQVESDKLVHKYCQIDERCHQLAILLRSFASLSEIDHPERGGMMSRTFPLLVIFYLQVKPDPPVLPNLHRIAQTNVAHLPPEAIYHAPSASVTYLQDLSLLEKFFSVPRNTELLAQLWLDLLRFYVLDFNKDKYLVSVSDFHPVMKHRVSSTQHILSVQEPVIGKRNMCYTVSPVDVFTYIHEQLQAALCYFSVPQMASDKSPWGCEPLYVTWNLVPTTGDTEGGADNVGLTTVHTAQRSYAVPLRKVQEEVANFQGESNPERGNLQQFLELVNKCVLENVCLQLPPPEDLCSISEWNVDITPLQRHDHTERWQRYAMEFAKIAWDMVWREYFAREDYLASKDELGRFLEKAAEAALVEAVLAGNQKAEPPPVSVMENSEVSDEQKFEDVEAEIEADDGVEGVDADFMDPDVEEQLLSEEEGEVVVGPRERIVSATLIGEDAPLVPYVKSGWAVAINRMKHAKKVTNSKKPGFYSTNLVSQYVKRADQLHFVWDKVMLRHREPFVQSCALCQRQGHLRDDCNAFMPDLTPKTRPKPEIVKNAASVLSPMLETVVKALQPSEEALQRREETFQRLQSLVLERFPQAQLDKFGSSVNGFGFAESDLDVHFTMPAEGEENDENMTHLSKDAVASLVVKLERLLTQSGLFTDVLAIKDAKVPVVKFKDLKSGVEGDISFTNLLALQNSRMLLLYSTLNLHCRTLGLLLKYLMKACGVCDASRGSLSSYAYIVLLIHYLQHRNCLPCLQLCHKEEETKPVRMIENFDCWFQDNLDTIREHWRPPEPMPSVGELWLGFFEYYLYEFNFKEHVVTVRMTNSLFKGEKFWMDGSFAIEDPFELSHNLGSHLTRKMFSYILTVFSETLKLHCCAGKPLTTFSEIVFTYFNPNYLTNGDEAPKERGCHLCGKIGHVQGDCPLRAEKNRGSGAGNISCKPLVAKRAVAEKGKGGEEKTENKCPPVNLLCVTPRCDQRQFMATQPYGQFGWPEGDGFSVEPLLLDLGNNVQVMLPILTHPSESIMRSLAQRQAEVAKVITPQHLLEYSLKANPQLAANLPQLRPTQPRPVHQGLQQRPVTPLLQGPRGFHQNPLMGMPVMQPRGYVQPAPFQGFPGQQYPALYQQQFPYAHPNFRRP